MLYFAIPVKFGKVNILSFDIVRQRSGMEREQQGGCGERSQKKTRVDPGKRGNSQISGCLRSAGHRGHRVLSWAGLQLCGRIVAGRKDTHKKIEKAKTYKVY